MRVLDASFSENFYGLKRIRSDAPPGNKQLEALQPTDRRNALIYLVQAHRVCWPTAKHEYGC